MTFRKYLSHGLVILSSMFVVFFALDIRNPAMAWIDNRISKTLLLILAIAAMTLAINTLRSIRRYECRQAQRNVERQRAARRDALYQEYRRESAYANTVQASRYDDDDGSSPRPPQRQRGL